MGKVRIKHMGIEEFEQEEREKRRRQREQKRIREEGKIKKKRKKKDTRAPGLKGGERVVSMTSEEEVEALVKISKEAEEQTEKLAKQAKEEEKKKEKLKVRKRVRSRKYKKNRLHIDKDKYYSIEESVKLLKKVSYSRFNGTVEAHINTKKLGIRGTIALPHGTGKKRRVAIADDRTLAKVAQGKIDFDVLIATPAQMSKVAKVARILGPKGLMPNPKTGTISDKPEKLKKELEGGTISYKTEAKQPIIHQTIGKVDFADKRLVENFEALIAAIGKHNIVSITLAASMSPGIKVSLAN